MPTERRQNPNRSLESLESSLRAWPQPPVPADLEARLLASIPAEMPLARRRWGIWVGVACASAAACLLAVLTWSGRDGRNPVSQVPANSSVRQVTVPSLPAHVATHEVTPRAPNQSASNAPWLELRGILAGAKTTTFNWPLQETSPMRMSTSIPADLLD
jgi:hypothetical protein